jgi:hypothetical protein
MPLSPTILLSQACSECHSTWFCLRGTKQSLACIASQVFWGSGAKVSQISQGTRKGKARESSYSNKTKAPSKDRNNWTNLIVLSILLLPHLCNFCTSLKTLQQHQQNKKQPPF